MRNERNWLIDGPEDGVPFLFAHGAGAPMDTPFMSTVARGLAEHGIRVVRFEFPYMRRRRETGKRSGPGRADRLTGFFAETLRQVGDPATVVVGGKSMGGRVASLIADTEGVLGLVCLGYPFHPPGRAEQLRVAHLENMRTPALIIQGSRDAFGTPEEIAGYTLSPAVRLVYLEGGDHSFKPAASSGRTLSENMERAVEETAAFIRGLQGAAEAHGAPSER